MPQDKVMLHPRVSIADLARALERTGLAISNSAVDERLFVIGPVDVALSNIVPFEIPALLKRQAGPIHD